LEYADMAGLGGGGARPGMEQVTSPEDLASWSPDLVTYARIDPAVVKTLTPSEEKQEWLASTALSTPTNPLSPARRRRHRRRLPKVSSPRPTPLPLSPPSCAALGYRSF
jgi:hypothetical protein